MIGKTCKELTELVNLKFGTDFTVTAMKSYKKRYKLKSYISRGSKAGESKLFPEEIQEFIKSNASGKGNAELTALVNKHFGTEYLKSQIKSYKKNHHISSGLDGRFKQGHIPCNKGEKMPVEVYEKCKNTMFKKGNIPFNHKPVGSERLSKDGYIQIKIAEPNKWQLKHIVLWEEHNGKVPKNCALIFLDNNKENIVLENLALVSRAELLVINRSKLKSESPEITKVGINIAKVKYVINKRKKAGK